MEDQADAFEEVRRLGRLEGERFDRELREDERRSREARLSRLAFGLESGPEGWEPAGGESSAAALRLQRDVERLSAFHDAVVRSKAWRVIQALRRPFGRAW